VAFGIFNTSGSFSNNRRIVSTLRARIAAISARRVMLFVRDRAAKADIFASEYGRFDTRAPAAELPRSSRACDGFSAG
jgi:hypothetical protein